MQPLDFLGLERNRRVSPPEADVWVMAFRLGELADLADKFQGFPEISKPEFTLDAMSIVGNAFGEEPSRAAPILILMIINIHHYFTDGVIWKISNPEVRRELFVHVTPAPTTKTTGQRVTT